MLLASHGDLKADFLVLKVDHFVSDELLLLFQLLNTVLVKTQESHEELHSVFYGDEIFKNLTKIVNLYPFSKFIINLNPKGWDKAFQSSKIISKDPLLHRFILSRQAFPYPIGVDYLLSDFDSKYLMLVDDSRSKSEIIEFIDS